MSKKLETEIVVNLAGNLAAKARQYGNSMSDFAKRNEKAMTLLRSTTEAAGRGIDTLGNRYVGLAAGLVSGATIRGIANFEAQMTRIGTNAKIADDDIAALSQSIRNLSVQSDVRLDASQLATGVDVLLEKTGDFKFVQENLENMGFFMQAFGADAASTARLFAQFRAKGVTDAEAVMKSIDDLYSQFAVGSVNVKDLASISEQLFTIYGGKGPDAIRQMGALVQMFAKTRGSASEALTSIEGVFAVFDDPEKVKFLEQQGIQVFKAGTQELRAPVELLLDIVKAAGDSSSKLKQVFSDQVSVQGLKSLFGEEYKNLAKEMTKQTDDFGATQEAAAKNAATFNGAITSLNNQFNKFAESRLAQPIQDIADAINGVDQKTIDNWLKWGETALWVVGGLIAAKKGLEVASDLKILFGGRGAVGAGGGGVADMGVMPVYVVNMGQGGMGNGFPDVGGDRKTPKGGGQPSKLFGFMANLGTVGYAANMVYQNPDDWLPFDLRRKSTVDPAAMHGLPVAPGLLDVFDDIKRWFSPTDVTRPAGNSDIASMVNGIQSRLALDIAVSDDRIKVTTKNVPPGITVDPDTGLN
ncbi:phage tail tape measure protein [Shewanella khirikhana]|uniref:Phage-related minor tail protein n=1 Tax=Shewanella khirikhana TaxID=1965282 RepID=A0ABM7D154_9GAMM|nr:phage tail tape measure protein [Shewanella khirikhana]AZQ10118.1 Phage-related minor tail protein [Shewanella khirikhana]